MHTGQGKEKWEQRDNTTGERGQGIGEIGIK
jgi:hypothetical protein